MTKGVVSRGGILRIDIKNIRSIDDLNRRKEYVKMLIKMFHRRSLDSSELEHELRELQERKKELLQRKKQ